MKCSKCGKENCDSAKFCAYCGISLNTNFQKTKGRKWLIFFGIFIILVSMVIVFVFVYQKKYQEKQFKETVDIGNKYLEKMEYEQAKDSYLQAISIDSKQKEAYLGLIHVYVAQEKYELVVKTAEKAVEEVPNEIREEFEEIIHEWENIVNYIWIVNPEIEAEDINYICGQPYETDDYYLIENDRNAQYMCSYAVLTEKDGFKKFINMEGKFFDVGNVISGKIESALDSYLFTTENGGMFTFDGNKLGQWTGGDGVAGINWYYYSENLYDAGNSKETVISPRDLPMAIPLPITESIISNMSYGDFEKWFSKYTTGYTILNKGEIKTDIVYEECGPSRDGLMAVCVNGKWGYVNEDGKEIIPPEYDPSWILKDSDTENKREYCYAASGGFVVLKKDGQWELKYTDGTAALPAGIFEEIRPVYDGKCWVKKNGKWGVIQVTETTVQDEAQNVENLEDNSTINQEDNEILTKDELKQIALSLGVPDGLEIRSEVGEVGYYEAGERRYVSVSFYHEDEMVACANVDVDTLETINNIYTYSG